MLRFNTPQQIAENTIIDQIILETASSDQTISVSQFKGAVVVDPNLGNYVVIDFTVTDTAAMHIGRIRLMHGQTPVAISEDKQLLIVKEANKNLKIRLAAQFEGAENCKFNTTSVNLPYATPFREGVVRFHNGDEVNKSGTVYSAADVDAKIDAVTESLGNLKDYAKINAENTFAENNTFTKNVIVNGEIGGTAVTDAGTDGDKHIVNVGYADNKYLTKDTASSTYLSKNEAGTTYLTKNDASSTYLTKTDASTTYLTKSDATAAAGNYAKLNANNEFAAGTTNTFNGDVTVKGIFAVGESQNAAEFAVTSTGISGTLVNNDKVSSPNSNLLPTEGAVKSALNDIESALTQKDNDLQSQIDGINAGQNLADIVDTAQALAAYDVSHLKAKDDFQHGTSGAKWLIGDKVQVLGDANIQSCVYELIKGTKPAGDSNSIESNTDGYYWRYIGVYGTNAYTKSEIDTKVVDINNAIRTKADKSDVDAELANKVDKTQIITTIDDGTATATNVTSGSAVKTYVDTELAKKANSADVYSITDADKKFAKLAESNTFTGETNTFNGIIDGSAVTSDITNDAAGQGNKLTTSLGVKNYVDGRIQGLNLDGSYLKLSSKTVQTVDSSVAFNGIISGTAVAEVLNQTETGHKLVTVDYANEKLAQLASNNNFVGATNTFQAITATTVSANAFIGDGVTQTQMSEEAITQGYDKIVSLGFAENRYVRKDDISSTNKIGAMGLFLYTGGDFKAMGTDVHGSLLHAVGMQLPMDGVVSWSQGTAVSTAAAETTWKLLNNTIAGEPCLVLAIRVG